MVDSGLVPLLSVARIPVVIPKHACTITISVARCCQCGHWLDTRARLLSL